MFVLYFCEPHRGVKLIFLDQQTGACVMECYVTDRVAGAVRTKKCVHHSHFSVFCFGLVGDNQCLDENTFFPDMFFLQR